MPDMTHVLDRETVVEETELFERQTKAKYGAVQCCFHLHQKKITLINQQFGSSMVFCFLLSICE